MRAHVGSSTEIKNSSSRNSHLFKSGGNPDGLTRIIGNNMQVASDKLSPKNAPSRVTIAGYVPPSNNATNGIYSFDVSSNPSMTLLFHDDDNRMAADGGGTYYDGKYYYVEWHYSAFGDDIYAHYGIVETDNWTELYRSAMDNNPIDEHSIATDLTYCPADNIIYGIFEDYDVIADEYSYYFGYLNEYGDRVGVAQLDKCYWTIASNAEGELYAVDETGYLCKIDRKTGKSTRIGSTGITPYYMQSACFDFRTGIMYWVASGKSMLTALYTVDLTTGKATKVCNIPGDLQMLGIYVVDHAFADDAPYKPTDLSCEFERGSLSGKVNFTMPATTYSGESLTGSLNYEVTMNGRSVAKGSAAAGAGVSANVSALRAGSYEIAVSASNNAGDGPKVKTTMWVGDDIPLAPSNIKAEKNGTSINVSWDAPTSTSHGGYLNPATLRYTVIRFPDRQTVAENIANTSVIDNNTGVPITTYWYEVTSNPSANTGGSAYSNNLIFGTHYQVPYNEDFSSADSWSMFTTIDVNDDGKEWFYKSDTKEAACQAAQARDKSDDWLITAPIYMSADRTYILNFGARSMSDTYSETFEVAIGTSNTAAAMGRIIMSPTEVKSSSLKPQQTEFSVPSDGLYRIGFHCISPKYHNWLFIDDINIEEGVNLLAPEAVSDLTVIPGANGALSAEISFKAPVRTAAGETLSELQSITVYNGMEVIKTFENPVPGSVLSFTDSAPLQGENYYTVIARAKDTNSEAAVAFAWVGIDVPVAVSGIKALNDGSGVVTITWDPVSEGVHGGYVDPAGVLYYVARSSDTETFAGQLKSTMTTDRDKDSDSRIITYFVTAVNDGGQGEWGMSNMVALGDPNTPPMAESFAGMSLQTDPWGVMSLEGNGEWKLVQGGFNPFTQGVQDNDGGMISFVPMADGDQGLLYSGKMNVKKTTNPALTFYFYNNPGANGIIDVMISKNGEELESVKTIDFSNYSDVKGWTLVEIPLNDYKDVCKYICVGFKATGQGGKEIYIDNIRFFDNIDQDLTISDLSVPARLSYMKHALVNVTVKNIGRKESSAFEVKLLRNGDVVETIPVAETILPEGSRTVTFEELPDASFGTEVTYSAIVEYAADQNTANNTSKVVTVKVKQPKLPKATGLEISVKGDVAHLTWNEPGTESVELESVTDDFESYQPFLTNDLGDWLSIDVDGYETVGIQYGNYANMYEPKSWIVFNPLKAGLSVAYDDGSPNAFAPNSGSQYLAAFCSVDYNTGEDMPNDDWIISPELAGCAQTVTFAVKRLGMQYPESLEVYASSTGDNISDFVKVYSNTNGILFENWNTLSAELPEGTKYFAIRCNSYGGFCLMIDDVTYIPASETAIDVNLLGYNVYKDNAKVNDTPVEKTGFSVNLGDNKSHVFHVTALYDKGESEESNKVTGISESGISDVENSDISVRGGDGVIIISNAAGKDIDIYTIDGRRIFGDKGTDFLMLNVERGVYAVKAGAVTQKVIVK